MGNADRSYLIPWVKGRTDLLRMPEPLLRDLNFQSATVQVSTDDGRKLPVRLNCRDRTIVGLGPWLKERDSEDVRPVRLTITGDHPLTLGVELSSESSPQTDSEQVVPIARPHEGLYLGGKLVPEFYELVRTNESIALDESDLMQHVFICGTTGSGKTVLAKCLIEEAARAGIPVIAIDLKGDISSMAVLFSGEDPTELLPWVKAGNDESRESVASRLTEKHKANLAHWGLGGADVDDLCKRIAVNVFTPRSNAAFRLALSAFVEPPDNLTAMRQRDPDAYEDIIQFLAKTFVSRLTLNRQKAAKAEGYVYEIIRTFWEKGETLRGYEGIKKVLDEVRLGGLEIEMIGGMPIDEFISQKDREDISTGMNALLIGAQRLWFQGFPLDIEQLTDPANYDKRTPVSIVNIKHLSFQDQAYVVGYVAYLIWFWMRRLEGVERPRLIFYIDEIGGGGSKEAFFPSVASSPSKPALNYLLRQGRAFGVCCVFATQSPGDIDYKALGQCGTWAVGQLRRKRERDKIAEGAGEADLAFESVTPHIAALRPGQFLIRSPSLPWTIAEERWLMHLHRVLSQEDLERLKADYEKDVSGLFEEAQRRIKAGHLPSAKDILRQIVGAYRFSALYARSHLLLGQVLYDLSEFEVAARTLEAMIRCRMEAEETGEAYFLIGKCKEQIGSFAEAADHFARVASSAASDEVKENARDHEEYCRNRIVWPELSGIQKLSWWITGRKPDSGSLVRLEIRDREILRERFAGLLRKEDFSIPEPVDLQGLVDAIRTAASSEEAIRAEQLRVERWTSEQVPRIEAFLQANALTEAVSVCQKIVQRLQSTNVRASPSVLCVLEKCNSHCNQQTDRLSRKLRQIDARQFEFEIANLFRRKGYDVCVTSATRDDGVDVFAKNEDERVIIQCKRWSNPVGRDKVDELAGVKHRYGVNRAILVTTSVFSDDATVAGRQSDIDLWDLRRLKREWTIAFTEEN